MGSINLKLAKNKIFSMIVVWIIIFGGFIGFITFSNDNAKADTGQNLTVISTYTVSGSEIWKNITIKGNGKLLVPSGTTLNAWNIFLENGSIVEINSGTITLSTTTHAGNVGINGTCDYFNVTNNSEIIIIGSDGWANITTKGPYISFIPMSKGGDAVINISVNKTVIIKDSKINLNGGNGFDLPPSTDTQCNAWTNGKDISGYIASGGNATLNINCISKIGIEINNTDIHLNGGKGGNAADGGDGEISGSKGGNGGGYTGGSGGFGSSNGGRPGGNVAGFVGTGGNVNFIINSIDLDVTNTTIDCNTGHGGNAGDAGDRGGNQWTSRGGGGGGYGGGGGGSYRNPGGDGGFISGFVGAGGRSNIFINSSYFNISKCSINIVCGNGGKAGNGGSTTEYGAGGGGGYGGGGGGGQLHDGGDGHVTDFVGSGGLINFSIISNKLLNIISTDISCFAGKGGKGGNGGSCKPYNSGKGQGGGGGAGYGGGGGNGGGSMAGSLGPGWGYVNDSVGSGGKVSFKIMSNILNLIKSNFNCFGGRGGDAGNGGNGGGGGSGGGGGGYGGGGGGGTGHNGGKTYVIGDVGTGGDTFINISTNRNSIISGTNIKTTGGNGGNGGNGGKGNPMSTWKGGGGGGGYGGGGGSNGYAIGGKNILKGNVGDGGDAVIILKGKLAIFSDTMISARKGNGGSAPTKPGALPGGEGLGRTTSMGKKNVVIPKCLPYLISPLNNSIIYDITPMLSYYAYDSTTNGDVSSYWIQLDNNSDFSSPSINTTIGSTSYILPTLTSEIFYWRVMANYSTPPDSNIGWSNINNFEIPKIPFVTNVQKSTDTIYRNNSITFNFSGYHYQEKESDLYCKTQYKSPTGTWNNLTGADYIGNSPTGFWQISYKPSVNAELGEYSFRCRFNDSVNNWSLWEYDTFNVKNNLPTLTDFLYSTLNINRTQTLIIFINASDVETPEHLLNCIIYYRSSIGSWTEITSKHYQAGRWIITFTPSSQIYVGAFDFKIKIVDGNMDSSDWTEHLDKIYVLNNHPKALDIKYSSLQLYRTNSIILYINGTDIENSENSLLCIVQYRSPSSSWINLSNSIYNNDHWEVIFTPSKDIKLGKFDIRVRFKDKDGNYSSWLEDFDNITIKNNIPKIQNIKYSNFSVFRTKTLTIYINGSDIENLEDELLCKIQYRTPSSEWIDITNEKYKINHWEATFIPSINAELGTYDFRYSFIDLDNDYNDWFVDLDMIIVKNNVPEGVISYSKDQIYRTDSLVIYANGTDIETSKDILKCEIQYKTPSGVWKDFENEEYKFNFWQVIFNLTITIECGPYDFRVKFTDADQSNTGWIEDSDAVLILNNKPSIITHKLDLAIEDEYYEMIINSTDIETTLLNGTYKSDAEWLEFASDGINLFIYGLPDNDDVGGYWVIINVSDGHDGYDERNYTLIVNNTNDNPVINTKDQLLAIEDEFYSVIYSAIDDDFKDTLYWTFNSNATWLKWNPLQLKLYGTPTNDNVGEYWVKIKVTDNHGGSDEHYFILKVLNVNDAPVISGAPKNLTINALEEYLLDFSQYVNDVDNNLTDLTIHIDSKYVEIDGLDIIFNFPNSVLTEEINITVSDGEYNSNSHTIQITIISTDIDLPMIKEKSPTGNEVATTTNITVTFNEPMDQLKVEESFSIFPTIKGEFTWNNNTMTFVPESDLYYTTTYIITIDENGTDLVGNPLDKTYRWTFTTKMDTDGDKFPDDMDKFPNDPKDWLDTDNDNVGDNSDDFPLDMKEWVDTDGDNIGNNADPDDDNDGINDSEELKIGTNPLLNDTDGDFYHDGDDAYPLDNTKWKEKESKYEITNLDWIWILISIIIIISIILIVFLTIKYNRFLRSEQHLKNNDYYYQNWKSYNYNSNITRRSIKRRNNRRRISPSQNLGYYRKKQYSKRRSNQRNEMRKSQNKSEEFDDLSDLIEWDE